MSEQEKTTPTIPGAWLLEQFEDYLVFERNLAGNTIGAYVRDVATFAAEAVGAGRSAPAALDRAALADYLNDLAEAGLAASSLARKLSSLRLYFKFLTGEGAVPADPPGPQAAGGAEPGGNPGAAGLRGPQGKRRPS
jgi:site-specific recombinase XerD